MNTILYILFFFTLLSCSSETNSKSETFQNSYPVDSLVIDSSTKSESSIYTTNCNFIYDTIKDKNYSMHLRILDKFYNIEKRGYFYLPNGDTLNKFLYHQDITTFIAMLNPKETGVYKKLTNKVIFLILENEPKMLDVGLNRLGTNNKLYNYFMKHVLNPICNELSIDSTLNIIKSDMEVSFYNAKWIKEKLIENLKKSKDRGF